MPKFVYTFGNGQAEGDGALKELLGGKGAGLAEMTRLGIPVPPGFTITTEVCTYHYAHGQQRTRPSSTREVRAAIAHVEKLARRAPASATPPIRCSSRCAPARASRCRA